MDKATEYLRLLQEKNRLKKLMSTKSKEEQIKEDLEKGFSTHFRGAHANKETKASSHQVMTSVKPLNILGRIAQSSKFGWNCDGKKTVQCESQDNEQERTSSTPGVHSDDYAQPGNHSNYEYESDFENYSDVENDRITKPKSERLRPMSAVVEDTNETGNDTIKGIDHGLKDIVPTNNTSPIDSTASIDASLQCRVQELSAAQKLKLLELLQNDATSTVVPSSEIKNSSLADNFVHSQVQPKEESCPPDIGAQNTYNFRVRITSSWNPKSRFVSLGWLRLRLPPLHNTTEAVDLLPGWTCRLYSGLQPLPASSEAVRELGRLLTSRETLRPISAYRRLNSEANIWKAPLSMEHPLELHFSGKLATAVTNRLNDVELIMCNAAVMSLNSAAAMDVDVFVGKRCVWSGRLDEVNSDAATGYETQIEEHPVSVTLFRSPVSAPQSITKKHTLLRMEDDITTPVNNAIVLTNQTSSVECDRPQWLGEVDRKPTQQMSEQEFIVRPKSVTSRRRLIDKDYEENKEIDSTGSITEPCAFSAEQITTTKREQRKPSSSRPHYEVLASNKLEDCKQSTLTPSPTRSVQAPEEDAEKSMDSPHFRTPTKRRAPRRERDTLPQRSDKECLNFDLDGFSSVTSASRVKEREAELKRSLETMAFNDKFNLGRLSASKLPLMNSAQPDKEEDENCRQDLSDAGVLEESLRDNTFIDDSLGIDLMVKDDLITPSATQIPEHCTAEPENIGLVNRTSPQRKVGLSQAAAVRAEKIDQVQEKIQSTLAGLARIMSDIAPTGSLSQRGQSVADLPLAPLLEQRQCNSSSVYPRGAVLIIDIFSSWGDAHYIGLNGIELYNPQGQLFHPVDANINDKNCAYIKSISANPSSLGILPEHSEDPRKVTNLLDGVNFTKNDMHIWLAPQLQFLRNRHPELVVSEEFSKDVDHVVATLRIEFDREVELAMCRIFNYNRSRARNQRGVKVCRFLLDNKSIYQGEIKKATGMLHSEELESHVIYFGSSMNEQQEAELRKSLVCASERTGLNVEEEVGEASEDLEQSWAELSLARPKTAERTDIVSAADSNSFVPDFENVVHISDKTLTKNHQSLCSPVKPTTIEQSTMIEENTAIYIPTNAQYKEHVHVGFDTTNIAGNNEVSGTEKSIFFGKTSALVTCRILRVDIESTWGDTGYVGLSGLQVLLGPAAQVARISAHQLHAQPKDLSDIGSFDDPRVLSNLLKGPNNTADDTKMWLIPFTKGSEHYLQVDLGHPQEVCGLRFWNYNKASEHVMRGSRQIKISADGKTLFQCILRPGPGCDGVRFEQDVLFADLLDVIGKCSIRFAAPLSVVSTNSKRTRPVSYLTPAVRQDYETSIFPTGMMWRFSLFDNYNDQYYVGLDAIEFFDANGKLIDTVSAGAQIQAVPYSVSDVQPDSSIQDSRVPSQLLTTGASHRCGWLAPLARCMTPLERSACVHRVLGAAAQGSNTMGMSFPANNVVLVMFPQPITVSAIKLYNYSKTPNRGAREFLLDLDGLYLYMGTLLRADREKSAPQPLRFGGSCSRGQSVMFTNDARAVMTHKETVSYCGTSEQDLLCINERQVMVRSRSMYDQEPPNTSLEGVRSDLMKRPMTSVHPLHSISNKH